MENNTFTAILISFCVNLNFFRKVAALMTSEYESLRPSTLIPYYATVNNKELLAMIYFRSYNSMKCTRNLPAFRKNKLLIFLVTKGEQEVPSKRWF